MLEKQKKLILSMTIRFQKYQKKLSTVKYLFSMILGGSEDLRKDYQKIQKGTLADTIQTIKYRDYNLL